jgi:hypothetical protein
MSYTLFEDEHGDLFEWKDCEVAGCPNQVCIGRSDHYCWPHWLMGGDPEEKEVSSQDSNKISINHNVE